MINSDKEIDKKDFELKPLQVWKNTWWGGVKGGYIILLSAEHSDSLSFPLYAKRGRDEFLWDVAFSYKGMGCKIMKWYEDEIKKCHYMFNIQHVGYDTSKLRG